MCNIFFEKRKSTEFPVIKMLENVRKSGDCVKQIALLRVMSRKVSIGEKGN